MRIHLRNLDACVQDVWLMAQVVSNNIGAERYPIRPCCLRVLFCRRSRSEWQLSLLRHRILSRRI